jgi:ADP-heptose:LPS heptosyltransferase
VRLLVLRALGLGDLLTAVPALRALAAAFPEHERILAAPGALAPLVELIDTPAGERAVHRLADSGPLQALAPELAGAEMGVNLHGRGPQSHRLLLAARPKRLIAFEHAEVPESAGLPAWRAGEHEVSRWCRLLAESGIPADRARLELPPPDDPIADAARGATVIHPGAASGARRWPVERWAAVARAERERGRRVLVTGGPGELGIAQELARAAGLPPSAVLAGRTDLRALAAVVAAAGRVACGDTGVAHLATAFGTPSAVLFGPTPPAEWGPPAGNGRHVALWSGRAGDPHASRPDPGLLEIRPGQVMDALSQLP